MTKHDVEVGAARRITWAGDMLNRQVSARFLEKYVLRKFSFVGDEGVGSLCFAVDGDWGAGKSFFVNNWREDLLAAEHPVVHFDAWANDLADDPLVGFMASLRKQMQPLIGRLPVAERVRAEGKATWKKVVSNAGKALLPAAKVIANGVVKKVSGVDVGEVFLAAAQDDSDQAQEQIVAQAMSIGTQAAGKLFEEVMKSHDDRRTAVAALRSSLEELLAFLDEHLEVRLPLFVFVDELDRCRPDYAIRLLEGIKHLFEVRGVCFVVSTNLQQLSESTRAIYGSGFDAPRYLKRFFAFEYMLPEPDHLAFAEGLMSTSLMRELRVHTALPPTPSTANVAAANFAVVCEAFALDLRSQKQVLLYAEGAVATLDLNETIYCFPLFFFAALLHRSRKAFDAVEATWKSGKWSQEPLVLAGFIDATIDYRETDEHGRTQPATTSCLKVFQHYHAAVSQPLSTFSRSYWRSEEPDAYPGIVRHPVAQEGNGSVPAGDRSTAFKYPALLRAAGQLT